MNRLTAETLAELLIEAESAHTEYEKETGKRDENWPQWYANLIVKRLDEKYG